VLHPTADKKWKGGSLYTFQLAKETLRKEMERFLPPFQGNPVRAGENTDSGNPGNTKDPVFLVNSNRWALSLLCKHLCVVFILSLLIIYLFIYYCIYLFILLIQRNK
jgi:hypothetical protein